ncbi:diguanylate cyclase [Desulfuromonas versatilis]|uniref:Diguanylate cyclase n=1 Tax=Desulfuromonas versatilis TaxID=2802975 RepID=A0ABM8HRK4_9BACT|nr:diguanylate cyclase [Desulfuromonas versatilis]BCR03094.1 diguanylate cyclase [Desulfuromonas versatilis]
MATRILYMEDEPGLARLLKKRLERRGYQVDVATSGEDGLAMLAREGFDIVLVDYHMPGISGLEVIRRLRADQNPIPTIMVTGNGNEGVAVEAMKEGATDYLVKDVELSYLELLPLVIDQVLERTHLLREREQMLGTIRESEERYRKLVELTPDGIAVSVDDRLEFVNPAGTFLLGCSNARELLGRCLIDFVTKDGQSALQEHFRQLSRAKDSVPWVEGKLARADGSKVEVEISGLPFQFQGHRAVLTIFRDITDRKQAQARLEQMAHFDPLTGLPNRVLFFDRLGQAFLQAKRYRHHFALLFLDLDRFKQINDTQGHEIGDLVLKETARRLNELVRASDTVARMGGDEFTIILSRMHEPPNASLVAEKIIESLEKPFVLKGQEFSLSASVGIAVFPLHGESPEDLLRHSDMAMYQAKKAGRGTYQVFAPA